MTSWKLSRRQVLTTSLALGMVPLAGRFVKAAGRTLTVSSYSDLQVLDPGFFNSSQELNLVELTNQRLVRFKGADDTSWELDAAESIEQVDDTNIKFTLKQGIKWSGGLGEMTADDVKYSLERIANPDFKSPYASDWASLDRVEVADRYSGTIVLKEFSATLWTTGLPGWSSFINMFPLN